MKSSCELEERFDFIIRDDQHWLVFHGIQQIATSSVARGALCCTLSISVCTINHLSIIIAGLPSLMPCTPTVQCNCLCGMLCVVQALAAFALIRLRRFVRALLISKRWQ